MQATVGAAGPAEAAFPARAVAVVQIHQDQTSPTLTSDVVVRNAAVVAAVGPVVNVTARIGLVLL